MGIARIRQRYPSPFRVEGVWVALSVGPFLALFDTTMINNSLTTLQVQLGTDLTTSSWVLHAFNLSFAVLLIFAGHLADCYGHKRLIMLGLLLFLAGALLCSLAPTLPWLIGARVVQAACLNAASLAQLHTLFEGHQRRMALSVMGTLSALAATSGPLLGGVLLPLWGWRSIFQGYLPLCLMSLFVVWRFLPKDLPYSRHRSLDLQGVLMSSLALGCLVLALLQGNTWGWTTPLTLSLFGWALVSALLFVCIESQHQTPLLDLVLFRGVSFRLTTLITVLYAVAMQGVNLMLVLYLLLVTGRSQFEAALALLPVQLTSLFMAVLMSRTSRWLSAHWHCLLGLGMLASGLLLFEMLTKEASLLDIGWRGALTGAGLGLCVTSLPQIALAEVPAKRSGVSSGVYHTARQVGLALGAALLVSLLSAQQQVYVQRARLDAIVRIQAETHLPLSLRQKLVTHFFTGRTAVLTPPSQAEFMQFATHQGEQVPVEILAALSRQITSEFRNELGYAFFPTWGIAALCAGGGGGLVSLLLWRTHTHPIKAGVPSSRWQHTYCFSQKGVMTLESIEQYFTAQLQPLILRPALPPTRSIVPLMRQVDTTVVDEDAYLEKDMLL
ncbi:MAG: MFS transporter [Ktedonobacteraceae bacterium]|nr:MFS transporter [Ktedonobacteraceae bacterium]